MQAQPRQAAPALDQQQRSQGGRRAEHMEAACGLCCGDTVGTQQTTALSTPWILTHTAQPSLLGFLSRSPAPASRSLLKPHSYHTRSLGHWLCVSGENVHHSSPPSSCGLLFSHWPCFPSPLKQPGDSCMHFLHHTCQPPASPPVHPAWLLEARQLAQTRRGGRGVSRRGPPWCRQHLYH